LSQKEFLLAKIGGNQLLVNEYIKRFGLIKSLFLGLKVNQLSCWLYEITLKIANF
jgi:hypothetical protein